VHVPYKGGTEVMTDVISGRIDYHSIDMEPAPSSPQELHRLLVTEIEVRKKIFGAQAGKLQ
jgi:tripartite-type tricarboxylate transporter receptor subunit TctC